MKLSLLIATLCLYSAAFCQPSFGVKAGLTLPAQTKYISVGYYAGGYVNFPLSTKMAFIPELQIVQRNWAEPFSTGTTGHVKSTYVEVPLIFSFRPVNAVAIDLGPDFSYRLATTTPGGKGLEIIRYSNYDIGAVLGARFFISDRVSVSYRNYQGYIYQYTNKDLFERRYGGMQVGVIVKL